MRVAALYDIHGNVAALEAVLAELETLAPDTIVVGGDFVAGPFPAETLALLDRMGANVRIIRGNADREVVDAYRGRATTTTDDVWKARRRWVTDRMTARQIDWIEGLPETCEIEIDGLGATLFCHATPRSDEEIFTTLTPESRVAEMLTGVSQKVVVCGHTHMQFDRPIEAWRVVNAGSVGLAYEGRPAAFWALLGPGVDLRVTSYDHASAAAATRDTTFPEADDYAQRFLLHPPGPKETAEFFEAMAQKQAAGA